MVLEVADKDMGGLGGISLILMKKRKAVGREGGFCGSRPSYMAGVNNKVLPFIIMDPF